MLSASSGLSSSDSALFDPQGDKPDPSFANRASLDFDRFDDSEADILGGADTIHPQGGVFFIEESRRALSPIRSASPDGVPTSTAPRIRPSSAAAASTSEKKERKSRWKRLLPSALMRRAGKSRKTKGDVVDERVGKTQTIVIRVPTGRRIDSLESLGIVAGRSFRGEEKGRFQVKRLVSDGLAEKTNEIRIGDYILALNGTSVTKDIIDQVLRDNSNSNEISLTVYRMGMSRTRVRLRRHASTATPALIHLFNGTPSASWKMTMSGIPHCVMYLKLTGDDDSEGNDGAEKDVLYSYPGEDSHWRLSKILLNVRGAFLTLGHMMEEVAGSHVESSTVFVNDQLVHVGYRHYGRCLLLLALPARTVHLHSLVEYLDDVCKLFAFLYGSVPSAFESSGNFKRLDHTFSLIFERLLSPGESGFSTRMNDTSHGLLKLYVQPDLLVKASSVLSDLESDDHSETFDVLVLRRKYRIRSSCLFYKGYLVDSHMTDEDLSVVGIYCRYHCILSAMRKQKLGHVVIWTKVFSGEEEAAGQKYLLLVGMANALVCVLMETGWELEELPPHVGLDPLYIDLAREVILTLNVRGLLEALDMRLTSSRIPAVTQADDLVLMSSGSSSLSVPDSDDLGRHKSRLVNRKFGKPGTSSLTKCAGLVFHYVNVDTVSGIIVAPTEAVPGQFSGPIHAEVVRSFHKACIAIRKVLKSQSIKNDGNKVREHGLLFHCPLTSHADRSKSVTTLPYWAIGRLVHEREFYVCFQDSIGWSAAEMAFRFAFGAMV
ncbi:protein inturned-like [Oscarella lobularis]|uniref:protein inturned-like n=1 Tax=Oscarella lobularis TaxID=121494 RepID=UPI003313FA5F